MSYIIERNNVYWHQYIALERDLVRIANFIEIHRYNMKTYSIELARLLLLTCSQVEITGKAIARKLGKKASNIKDIMNILTASNPDLASAEVTLPRYAWRTKPWSSWGEGKTPKWWSAYNRIKHNEVNTLSNGSLRNCIDALAALLLLTLALGHHLMLDAFKPGIELLYPPEILAFPDVSTDGEFVNLSDARK
ncbi:hypothetical protein RS982_08785 [Stenotrophomonas indicatrix]|uniref:hypothetical protein n=1 Tax=Stenotrophomonas indicatrix TaxID=2045451 RepID=UPI0028EE119A|nr:hypothetical protein [Stenotrophomonas indicatrix]MDT9581397.1 hypothetical protein [Stenotrophomonas indicatrix]